MIHPADSHASLGEITGYSTDARPHRDGFRNPVLPAPAQDPQALWHGGQYHYCESTEDGIFIRTAPNFVDFAASPRVLVWSRKASVSRLRHLWAPELHRIDGRFYIYFAADDGRNEQHRMWVLAGSTDDPAGPYQLAGVLDTEGWAIDGTVLCAGSGERYFVWSGWPGRRNGRQNLYAARMESPVALCGSRVLIAEPTERWERHGMPICEGPQVLQRDGRTFIVYSASGSWTEDYCLGLLACESADYLNPRAWHKVGPVFRKNEHACGVGHCGIITTPDGQQDWLLYHAKTTRRNGWTDREVRAQRFTWSELGMPVFGVPVSPHLVQARPGIESSLLARSA